jgi:hypothetical protein
MLFPTSITTLKAEAWSEVWVKLVECLSTDASATWEANDEGLVALVKLVSDGLGATLPGSQNRKKVCRTAWYRFAQLTTCSDRSIPSPQPSRILQSYNPSSQDLTPARAAVWTSHPTFAHTTNFQLVRTCTCFTGVKRSADPPAYSELAAADIAQFHRGDAPVTIPALYTAFQQQASP